MKRVYFVRHGLSQLGKAGLWAGSTDSPLAPEGRSQAKLAGSQALKLDIGYIISSPLSRAHDTALMIAGEIGYAPELIEINKLVVERNFGSLEATPWDPNYDVDSVPDAEPASSLLARAEEFWEYLQTIDAENILIVSHGSFGRALRHVIHPLTPFDNTHRFENAVIVQLV